MENNVLAIKKGILRKQTTMSEKNKSVLKESVNAEDQDDLSTYFVERPGSSQLPDQSTSYDHHVSLRQISDNDSEDENDGRFIPNSYVADRERRIEENKKKFKVGIKPKNHINNIDQDIYAPSHEDKGKYMDEQKHFRANVPPVDKSVTFEHDNIIQEAAEQEEQTIEPSDSQEQSESDTYQAPKRVNTSGYYAESESLKNIANKPITQITSELSVREPGDEYISASGEELASPNIPPKADDQMK